MIILHQLPLITCKSDKLVQIYIYSFARKVPIFILKSTIAIINAYPKFDTVFEPIAGDMRMDVKKYSGIRPMADDLNAGIGKRQWARG